MFPLKPISAAGVPAALQKAEHYRLLNQPWAAESICLDILLAEPGHQTRCACCCWRGPTNSVRIPRGTRRCA